MPDTDMRPAGGPNAQLGRVLANFFPGVHSAPVPVRFFTSNDEAVRWLAAQGHAGG